MQKEIQLTDKTLLVVGIPDKSKDCYLATIHGDDAIVWQCDDYMISFDIIPQGYELLGIYPELTEEQASRVIEKHKVAKDNYRDFTKTYFNSEWLWTCKTALESFQSLMERENITGYDKYAILIKSK